jgi:hypothetical protein
MGDRKRIVDISCFYGGSQSGFSARSMNQSEISSHTKFDENYCYTTLI